MSDVIDTVHDGVEPIAYVGDLHGRVKDIVRIDAWAVREGVGLVVQVGDFGARWPGQQCPLVHYFNKRARQGRPGPRWLVSPGNHDNWDLFDALLTKAGPDAWTVDLAPDLAYVRRGALLDLGGRRHLFLGGARSVDMHLRTEGSTWWAREQPSRAELELFFERLEGERPDVVVTHDCPSRVPVHYLGRETDPVSRALESVLSLSSWKPLLWFFGHHHVLGQWRSEGTLLSCCGKHGDLWVMRDGAPVAIPSEGLSRR